MNGQRSNLLFKSALTRPKIFRFSIQRNRWTGKTMRFTRVKLVGCITSFRSSTEIGLYDPLFLEDRQRFLRPFEWTETIEIFVPIRVASEDLEGLSFLCFSVDGTSLDTASCPGRMNDQQARNYLGNLFLAPMTPPSVVRVFEGRDRDLPYVLKLGLVVIFNAIIRNSKLHEGGKVRIADFTLEV